MVTLSVLLVLLGAALSEGCSCSPVHAQLHFCTSDFVLQVTVLDTEVDHSTYTRLYQAHVNQVFKMPENGPVNRDIVQLTTRSQGSLCGRGLEVGDTYIIGGGLWNGELHISLCGLKTTSDENSIKRMTYYSRHPEMCDCEVRACRGRCHESDGDGCTTDQWYSPAPDSCTDSVCSRSADGSCHWADVDTCQRKRNLPKWLKAASSVRSLFSKKQRGAY